MGSRLAVHVGIFCTHLRKLLLNAILEDEKRHHGLLKQILEVLVKGETITEADWWDILWKDVPFHGSPGG